MVGPCKNVWIHDCKVFDAHGGFVVGSEMSRGVENIIVEDCSFIGTDIGIRFKSALGRGGVVENITIRNITMTNIIEEACIFTMGYVLKNLETTKTDEMESTLKEDVPEFKNIYLEDIVCQGAKIAIKINGLKQLPIHHLYFKNVSISANQGLDLSLCEDIHLDHVAITLPDQIIKFENEILKA